MSERPKRPLSRRIQARVMGALNIPMRVILRLPFATPLSQRLMLISFTGRKTGKSYRQPVSYVQEGNTLLTPGGGNWKWNLQDVPAVRIRLRGRDVLAQPELADPRQVSALPSADATKAKHHASAQPNDGGSNVYKK